jgi:hypothetical protein
VSKDRKTLFEVFGVALRAGNFLIARQKQYFEIVVAFLAGVLVNGHVYSFIESSTALTDGALDDVKFNPRAKVCQTEANQHTRFNPICPRKID